MHLLLIKKLLESAVANAENNNGMKAGNLYVEECYANQAPTMKRIKPRAQGRAYRILKENKPHYCSSEREIIGGHYGTEVNPHGMRVGIIKDWNSKWYAEADFSDNLVEDYNIRKFLKKKLYSAGVSKIDIERASDRVKIIIFTAKPGIVIGKGGAEIEKLKGELAPYVNGKRFL